MTWMPWQVGVDNNERWRTHMGRFVFFSWGMSGMAVMAVIVVEPLSRETNSISESKSKHVT